MAKLDGSCMCGKVAYSCPGDPVAVAVCHCTTCQKQSGSAFSINVAVARDALSIEGDGLSSYATVGTDTGAEVRRQFCRECGSPIASLPDGLPELALIKAGTLHDTSWLEPQMHVWCDSAQPWIPLDSHAETTLPRGLPA